MPQGQQPTDLPGTSSYATTYVIARTAPLGGMNPALATLQEPSAGTALRLVRVIGSLNGTKGMLYRCAESPCSVTHGCASWKDPSELHTFAEP